MMQLPNTLGFVFGIIQMVMYLIYRNATPPVELKEDPVMKVQELNGHVIDVIDIVKLSNMVPSDPTHIVVQSDPNGKQETKG